MYCHGYSEKCLSPYKSLHAQYRKLLLTTRAAVGRLGVRPEAGRPDRPAWQDKVLEIIIDVNQLFPFTVSINEACHSSLSVSTIPMPSAQPLKHVANPDLWEHGWDASLAQSAILICSVTLHIYSHQYDLWLFHNHLHYMPILMCLQLHGHIKYVIKQRIEYVAQCLIL